VEEVVVVRIGWRSARDGGGHGYGLEVGVRRRRGATWV
jgi:hypothetical protein